MYGQLRKEVGAIQRKLYEYKEVEVVSGSIGSDHIHMCLKIPPKLAVSQFMRCLKGKSALMIFDKHPEYKKGTNGHFWARGYFVNMVGIDKEAIKVYIKNQVDAYCLDVTFHEDDCRTRKDNSAENLSVVRKIALNILKNFPIKMSLARKRR